LAETVAVAGLGELGVAAVELARAIADAVSCEPAVAALEAR
jgi:hypothetical protein